MKKISLMLSMVAILSLQGFAEDAKKVENTEVVKVSYKMEQSTGISIEDFKKAVGGEHFLLKDKSLQIVSVIPINDEFFIVKGTQIVDMRQYGKTGYQVQPIELYVSKTGKTSFSSVGLNEKGEQLTLPLNLEQNKDLAAFTYGNGEKEVYLFTDPDCPYCIQFEQQLAKLKPEYKIYVYLFPLESIHPDARKKSEYIMSLPKDKRAEAYKAVQGVKTTNTDWKVDVSQEVKDSIRDMIKYQNDYVGVKGTPFLVDKNGKPFNRGLLF